MTICADGRAVRERFLPYALPSIGDEEIAEVVDSLRSGWITTGPKVKRFEEEFATRVGARHAIAVNSCTAGLHVALTALGIQAGDEVIVPTLTFCATANVVVHLGARPVLVDVGLDGNVIPDAVAAAITRRTRAIMPVHYGGQACDLAQLHAIAERHGLALVEDAAHASGTTYCGRPIGSDALLPATRPVPRATVFSFYATKNMTTGEGGMITTADDDLADRARRLRLHGMSRDAWKRYTSSGSWYYEVIEPGYKDNMTDIQAALGLHQLRKLDAFTETRQRYAQLYDDLLADIPEIDTPPTHPDRNHVYHLYVIRLKLDELSIDRGRFIEELKTRNIGTSVHFIPVHLHPFYRTTYGYAPGSLPASEALYDRIVSLPLYPAMTEGDVRDVAAAVRAIVAEFRLRSWSAGLEGGSGFERLSGAANGGSQ
jgi:dTDP-4-amino-4,6-dideoxygalactose transaminase